MIYPNTLVASPELAAELARLAPELVPDPVLRSGAMLKGAPLDLMGIPVVVSEFLPSWLAGIMNGTMLVRWNREYREMQASKLRGKGWRVQVKP